MKRFVITVALLFSASAIAEYRLNSQKVIAPTVPNTTALTGSVGSLVFDASSNAFKGYDLFGTWQKLAAENPEKTVQVRFGGSTDFTACATSPCTVYSQSGSWITSVTIDGQRYYNLNIATGTFSGRPTCTCVAQDPGVSHLSCDIFAGGNDTNIKVGTVSFTGSTEDAYVEVICVGPR